MQSDWSPPPGLNCGQFCEAEDPNEASELQRLPY